MTVPVPTLEQARTIADEVLYPAAADVDRTGSLPPGLLDRLAVEGFYGLADTALGMDEAGAVLEALAGGCLSAAFVYIQHHGPVRAVAGCPDPAVRERWLGPLVAGTVRAGIALAGLRPGPDQVRVCGGPDGWRVSGTATWVTGWGLVDVVQVAAVDDGGTVRMLLVDAAESATLSARRAELAAVQASATVELTFREHEVPGDRLVASVALDDWVAGNASGSALNGFLALGVTGRCLRLLDDIEPGGALAAGLADERDRCRTALLAAGPSEVPAARAACSLLAARAAAALAVATGSRSAYAGSAPDRLLREAAFLLVFASRPLIRTELLQRLGG